MTTEPVAQLPLALVAPSPHRLVRRGDGGGSLEAAVRIVESGDEASQVLWTIGLVTALPGRTSAELAEETKGVGLRLGYTRERWRSLLARRLSTAEDQGHGPILGHEWRFRPQQPWRTVDPGQADCRVAQMKCIRWWPNRHPAPKEEAS